MADVTALIDYGAGNLHSVENALRAVGGDVLVTDNPDDVRRADRIVLPGVGSFKACMDGLSAISEMTETLQDCVVEGHKPFLGICVGMQLMAEHGLEHGTHTGLGWVAGSVSAMEPTRTVKIPHMGWNVVEPVGPKSLIEPGEAYFLHSYAFTCEQIHHPSAQLPTMVDP